MTDMIDVQDLSFRYSSDTETDWLLHRISLHVEAGEFVVIAGNSGVGKSTLLYCINGIVPRIFQGDQKGQVRVLGKHISDLSMGRLSHQIGTVLQDPDAQVFNLTVEDELAFGCENLGLPPPEIAQRLSIAEGTVKMHLAGLLRVLGASNRAHAAALGKQYLA